MNFLGFLIFCEQNMSMLFSVVHNTGMWNRLISTKAWKNTETMIGRMGLAQIYFPLILPGRAMGEVVRTTQYCCGRKRRSHLLALRCLLLSTGVDEKQIWTGTFVWRVLQGFSTQNCPMLSRLVCDNDFVSVSVRGPILILWGNYLVVYFGMSRCSQTHVEIFHRSEGSLSSAFLLKGFSCSLAWKIWTQYEWEPPRFVRDTFPSPQIFRIQRTLNHANFWHHWQSDQAAHQEAKDKSILFPLKVESGEIALCVGNVSTTRASH